MGKEEIDEKLKREKDAYSNAKELAELFIDDRTKHVRKFIRPNIKAGAVVISSRYKMSTCAYQWTQGMDLWNLLEMHEDRGIIKPDITFFLDVPREVAQKRIADERESTEKFEGDVQFVDRLIHAYYTLVEMAKVDERIFGRAEKVDGTQSIKKVADYIFEKFLEVYDPG